MFFVLPFHLVPTIIRFIFCIPIKWHIRVTYVYFRDAMILALAPLKSCLGGSVTASAALAALTQEQEAIEHLQTVVEDAQGENHTFDFSGYRI